MVGLTTRSQPIAHSSELTPLSTTAARLRRLLTMPLEVFSGAPTLLVRKAAFERAGLVRAAIDARFNLTADEFRVEGGVIAIGPLYEDDALGMLVEELEAVGLVYFDDFFELPGNWPSWLRLFEMSAAR